MKWERKSWVKASEVSLSIFLGGDWVREGVKELKDSFKSGDIRRG